MSEKKHEPGPLRIAKSELFLGIIEIVGWLSAAYLVDFFIQTMLYGGYRGTDNISLLLMAVALFTPSLYYLVNSRLPLQDIRLKKIQREKDLAWRKEREESEVESEEQEENLMHQLEDNFWMAKDNSEKIYTRSNTFLFVGAFIAVAGVVFFYWQSHSSGLIQNTSYIIRLELIFQRFGTLFFIEAIAFFFLKQYSNSMEDYRYYEAIKRQRENQFTLALAFKEHDATYVKNFSETCAFNVNPDKLTKDETTQLLEAKKLIGPDTDVLQKFIDLVQVTRKN